MKNTSVVEVAEPSPENVMERKPDALQHSSYDAATAEDEALCALEPFHVCLSACKAHI